jgi:non-specific serine/threonine protein kinase
LLGSLGDVIWLQGDAVAARSFLEEGLATARTIEDPWMLGEALHYLGWYLGRQGEHDQSLTLLAESLDLARKQGRQEGWSAISWTLDHMGDVARAQGDLARAATLYEESLSLFRAQGHTQGVAAVLHNQGHLALLRGDTESAKALFTESLVLFRSVKYRWSVADCLAGLGGVAAQEGQAERAALLLGAAEAIHAALDASGTLIEPVNRVAWEEAMARARQQIDEAAWEAAWAAGRALPLDQAVAAALGETS